MNENILNLLQRPKLIKIYENSDFLIVSKPGGIEFHTEEGALALVRTELSHDIFGVHRLDKKTSGIMLFAKSKQVQSDLSVLFMQNKITKYYLAVANNKPRKKMGMIIGDLYKGRGGNYYLSEKLENPSKTAFLSALNTETQKRCFILRPFTGKTHQLRVVMKSLGAPICGDKRYGGEESSQMSLHAFYLQFDYKGESYVFSSLENSSDLLQSELIRDTFKSIWQSEIATSIFKDNERKTELEI